MFRLKQIVLILSFCCVSVSLKSQKQMSPKFPDEGSKVPNFTFTNVRYYQKNTISLNDFRGKWLIIEFFSKNCVPCFKSFPKLNELQKKFKDSVQFLLVGLNEGEYSVGIEDIYEKHRLKYNLTLPVAYDSINSKHFNIRASSHINIIDPNGVNRIISLASGLTEENIHKLLNGNIEGYQKTREELIKVTDTLFSPKNISASSAIYRSMIGPCASDIYPVQTGSIEGSIENGYIYEIGLHPMYLFKLAYVGTAYWMSDSLYDHLYVKPIVECKDSALFVDEYGQLNNNYNYSLLVPKERLSREFLMEVMQRDLATYFNVAAGIEKRSVPIWKLAMIDSKKLMAKKRIRNLEKRRATNGYITQKTNIKRLLNEIKYYNASQPNIIDGTGFTGTFDIKLDVLMTDIDDVNAGLRKHGIELLKENRLMDVLVIKDIR